LGIDPAGFGDGSEIAHAAQQAPGDARRAAGAARDLSGAVGGEIEAQYPCPTPHDLLQLAGAVEVETQRDAEAFPQPRGEEAERRRTVEQSVVQGFVAMPRRLDEDGAVLPQLLLADELGELERTQGELRLILGLLLGGDDAAPLGPRWGHCDNSLRPLTMRSL